MRTHRRYSTGMKHDASGSSQAKVKAETEYGVLKTRNIDTVVFGDYEFETWYGNSAYFAPPRGREKKRELGIDSIANNGTTTTPGGLEPFWLLTLFVCEYCFKYTANEPDMALHRTVCELNTPFPPLGKLVYWDSVAPYLIKRIRGYRHELFAQNLSLFGKLFLDDKSVYYNVEYFDFYVVYGFDDNDPEIYGSALRKPFKPMGFFSHEVNAWDPHNNLACVCVFPPFQGRRLGSLLIEFLYALAASSEHMKGRLGPEFPLSPYGKELYLRFWCKRLAFLLLSDRPSSSTRKITLTDLANATGFRREDILYTLDHMGVLSENDRITLLEDDLRRWCDAHGLDYTVEASMMNPQCLRL